MLLCGEDEKQIVEFINKCKTLVGEINSSVLSKALLKCSAFNNLALPKILHYFYNTRLFEIHIESLEKYLVSAVRDWLKLHKSFAQLAILLLHEHGGLAVKKLSFVYYNTRIDFLVKMLNHDVEEFSFIARESLKFDVKNRNVTFVGFQRRNFLGYELDKYGRQSDWVDLIRYTSKIGVNLELRDNKVVVLKNGTKVKPAPT